MSMSMWEKHKMTSKVLEVLESVETPRLKDGTVHHFGKPFMDAYQIAIEIERRHHGIAARLGKSIGGAARGRDGMTQYISNELSKQIKGQGDDHPVQGRFLSTTNISRTIYSGPSGEITSSLGDADSGIGIYRVRPRV